MSNPRSLNSESLAPCCAPAHFCSSGKLTQPGPKAQCFSPAGFCLAQFSCSRANVLSARVTLSQFILAHPSPRVFKALVQHCGCGGAGAPAVAIGIRTDTNGAG